MSSPMKKIKMKKISWNLTSKDPSKTKLLKFHNLMVFLNQECSAICLLCIEALFSNMILLILLAGMLGPGQGGHLTQRRNIHLQSRYHIHCEVQGLLRKILGWLNKLQMYPQNEVKKLRKTTIYCYSTVSKIHY